MGTRRGLVCPRCEAGGGEGTILSPMVPKPVPCRGSAPLQNNPPCDPPPPTSTGRGGEHFPQRPDGEVASVSRRVMESSAAAGLSLKRRKVVRVSGRPGPQGLGGLRPGVFHSSIEGMRDCEGRSSGMAGGGRPPRPHAFYSCFLPTCDPLPSLYGNLWGRPQGHMCAPAAGCPGLCLPAACFSNLSRLSPLSLSFS